MPLSWADDVKDAAPTESVRKTDASLLAELTLVPGRSSHELDLGLLLEGSAYIVRFACRCEAVDNSSIMSEPSHFINKWENTKICKKIENK